MATRSQKQWTEKWVKKYQSILLLQMWNIASITYSTIDHAGDTDEQFTAAEINPLPNYYEAVLTIYPKFWKRCSLQERKRILLHELIHCLTEEVAELGRTTKNSEELGRANERQTELFTSIVWGLL